MTDKLQVIAAPYATADALMWRLELQEAETGQVLWARSAEETEDLEMVGAQMLKDWPRVAKHMMCTPKLVARK